MLCLVSRCCWLTCTAHRIHGLLWASSALEMLWGELSLATFEDLKPSSRSLQGLGKDISVDCGPGVGSATRACNLEPPSAPLDCHGGNNALYVCARSLK